MIQITMIVVLHLEKVPTQSKLGNLEQGIIISISILILHVLKKVIILISKKTMLVNVSLVSLVRANFKLSLIASLLNRLFLTNDNQKIPLSQLKVGQPITSSHGATSEVYSFLDYQLNVTLLYLELFYMSENGAEGKIAISHEHNILAQRGEKAMFVQAKDVQVGDRIFKSVNGEHVPVTVMKVGSGYYKGAIAPATMDGTLVVNDIVVSSYAAIDHHVAHGVLAPLRWGYWMSPALVNYHAKGNNGDFEFKGMHPYAKVMYEMFQHWVHQPSWFYASPTLDSY